MPRPVDMRPRPSLPAPGPVIPGPAVNLALYSFTDIGAADSTTDRHSATRRKASARFLPPCQANKNNGSP
jgi:hypothetical protein